MNNFIFENRTKVYFGKGCVKEYLGCLLRSYGETVMLVCEKDSLTENGIYDEIRAVLEKAGKKVTEFSVATGKPDYETVMEGAKMAREQNEAFILGAGDGAVTDCCKAIALAAVTKKDIWETYWEKPGITDVEPLPVGIVVTAAGSGSACSGKAVLVRNGKTASTGRDYPWCSPRFALMDPSYTCTGPVKEMISSGFDALSYMMESYFSGPEGDNVSDDIAEALMKSIIRNLRAALRNPEDYTARSNLLWASAMAGNRIPELGKKGDGFCHDLERQLETWMGCSPGAALAVIQPVYYRHICKDGLAQFVRFAENVWMIPREGRTDEEMALAGIRALENFAGELGLPATFGDGTKPGCAGGRQPEPGELQTVAAACKVSAGSYRRLDRTETEKGDRKNGICNIKQRCKNAHAWIRGISD